MGAPFQAESRLYADGGSAGGDRRARRGDRCGREVHDAPRRHRDRQDIHHGCDDRARPAAGAGDRSQQDARRSALQRVPRVLPRERGRVLRLLLRLLPARGVRPRAGPLHREGLVDQRRDRPPAPRRDGGAPGAARRRHRRLRLVHLRNRLARALLEADGALQGGGVDRPRRALQEARPHAVQPQRDGAHPRHIPREGRADGDLPGVCGVRLQAEPLRRRDRVDPPLRPADGGDPRRHRPRRRMARQPLRDRGRDDGAGPDRDQARAAGAARPGSRSAASCSRRTGCSSAPSTTSR